MEAEVKALLQLRFVNVTASDLKSWIFFFYQDPLEVIFRTCAGYKILNCLFQRESFFLAFMMSQILQLIYCIVWYGRVLYCMYAFEVFILYLAK